MRSKLPKEEPKLETWDDLPKLSEVDDYESRIAKDPWNVTLRAKLMMRYIWRREHPELQPNRLKHILWFVENVPDWKYCGGYYLSMRPDEYGYDLVLKTWMEQIEKSDNLMRRVNAYLFYQHEAHLVPNLFGKLFSNYKDNIWVRALKEMGNPEHKLFDDVFEEEQNKPFATERRLEQLCQLIDEKELLYLAYSKYDETWTFAKFEKARDAFEKRFSLKNLAITLGYADRHCHLLSSLQYDPEILITKIRLASWVIRNIPSHKMRNANYILFLPFSEGDRILGDGLSLLPAIKYICNLWLEQVDRFPDNSRVARNAAWFCKRIHAIAPDDHKQMMKHLGKTAIGKKALKSQTYR